MIQTNYIQKLIDSNWLRGDWVSARQANEQMKEIMEFLTKLDEWLDTHDKLSSNSEAHVQLDALLEKLK